MDVITVAALVDSARRCVEELEPERFAAEAARPETLVVDVREADERLAGTIAGAIHIPRGMVEFRADPSSPLHDERLQRHRRILLHCATGSRSALAATALHHLGYDDVAHLAGGFQAWCRADLPTVNRVPSPY